MFSFAPFDPTNEKELFGLYDDGEYDFLVVDCRTHTNQKNGNQSMKASIQVFGNNSSKMIDCYLTPAYKKLFVRFFRAIGMEDECKRGQISPEVCIDKRGRCLVGSDFPEPGSKYDPKNVIVDFVKLSLNEAQKQDEFINDPLPF